MTGSHIIRQVCQRHAAHCMKTTPAHNTHDKRHCIKQLEYTETHHMHVNKNSKAPFCLEGEVIVSG